MFGSVAEAVFENFVRLWFWDCCEGIVLSAVGLPKCWVVWGCVCVSGASSLNEETVPVGVS